MDRLYYLTVETPANTPLASPLSTPWPLEDNEFVYVDIMVPPGPSGLMGFRIMWASQQVVPWGNDSWLITDNEKIHVDCNFAMTITGLVIESYNTDIFPHTIYLRGLVRTMTPQAQAQVASLTGTTALPASQDLSEVGGIENYTSLPSDLSGDQDLEDANIGEDTGEIEPITEPPLVTITTTTTTTTTKAAPKKKIIPLKKKLPVRGKK
jgi:hypothetical protein